MMYATARRKRSDRTRSTSVLRDLVPHAPDGLDDLRLVRVALDLRAETLDVDVHEPRVAEVIVAPHLLEQLLAREDASGTRRERRQEPELSLRQGHGVVVPPDDPLLRTDLEGADADDLLAVVVGR